MNAEQIVTRTRALLAAVGQLEHPTPRIGFPKVQGWLLGWIAGLASDAPFDPAAVLDEPVVHEAMVALFEGMPNPFGDYHGSLGYTSLVEARRILELKARGEALDSMEEVRQQWLAFGHQDARGAIDGDERPARFLALFGR